MNNYIYWVVHTKMCTKLPAIIQYQAFAFVQWGVRLGNSGISWNMLPN